MLHCADIIDQICDRRTWGQTAIGPRPCVCDHGAGLRRIQTEATLTAYDQTLATYQLTVMVAFRDVEDDFTSLRPSQLRSFACSIPRGWFPIGNER